MEEEYMKIMKKLAAFVLALSLALPKVGVQLTNVASVKSKRFIRILMGPLPFGVMARPTPKSGLKSTKTHGNVKTDLPVNKAIERS